MVANRYKDKELLILESSSKPAPKIKISGGGRCNITNKNLSTDNYLGDPKFIKPILEGFDQNDLLDFLRARLLEPVIRKKSQYFCPHSSQELIDLLKSDLRVKIIYNHRVQSVKKRDDLFIIDDKFRARKLLVASGGLSFPSIGASGIAYDIAREFGHIITPTVPALVGLTLQPAQFWMKELSGISLEVKLSVGQKNINGDLLFAHKGISGPAVLNGSLYWEKGEINIDFLPKQKINKSLFKSDKKPSNALLLPKRFVQAFLKSLDLCDRPLSSFDESEREKLKLLNSYSFAPAGNFGYSKAEVTKGGIMTNEIDPKTMMSKKCKNLFFIGECLDVTGELGGYNIQWAFSSAVRVRL
jgi:predicted Rossmann fold flavoprotein